MILCCVLCWHGNHVMFTLLRCRPRLQPLLHQQVGSSHEGPVSTRAKAVHNIVCVKSKSL